MLAQTREVTRSQWREFLAWTHYQLQSYEVDGMYAELEKRTSQFPTAPGPLEVVEHDRRLAGAYLTIAPGRVAAVSGVRALPEHTAHGPRIVRRLIEQASAAGATQIQAIVDRNSNQASDILTAAGFQQMAILKHLWLQLPRHESTETRQFNHGPLEFVPVSSFSRRRIENLISSTFIDTLDCPAVNELRDPKCVLETFLDGQNPRMNIPWWIIQDHGAEIGCLFLNIHAENVAELVYMGLAAQARGKGFGRKIVEAACHRCSTLGCTILVAAVDNRNLPAVHIYDRFGFQTHRELEAWFLTAASKQKP